MSVKSDSKQPCCEAQRRIFSGMKWKEADDRVSLSLRRRRKARAANMLAYPGGTEGGARVQKETDALLQK